jgi:hypothetical protein
LDLAVGTELADVKASGWPRVRCKDLGDCGHAFAIPVAEAAVDSEVEGDTAPEGPPPPGEQGGPHGRFGWEEGDDDEQHVVGEAADEVQARRMRLWI